MWDGEVKTDRDYREMVHADNLDWQEYAKELWDQEWLPTHRGFKYPENVWGVTDKTAIRLLYGLYMHQRAREESLLVEFYHGVPERHLYYPFTEADLIHLLCGEDAEHTAGNRRKALFAMQYLVLSGVVLVQYNGAGVRYYVVNQKWTTHQRLGERFVFDTPIRWDTDPKPELIYTL